MESVDFRLGWEGEAVHCDGAVGEVWVDAGLLGGHSAGRVVDEKAVEQIETIVVEAWDERLAVVALPPWERWLEVWEGLDTGPFFFCWSA